jgi:hypothetical protein
LSAGVYQPESPPLSSSFSGGDEAQAPLLEEGDERFSHDPLPRLPAASVVLEELLQADRVVPRIRSRLRFLR